MMSREDQIRENQLLLVLQYDSQQEKVFTAFERIYIHKERSEILSYGDWKIPEELDEKVQEVLAKARKLGWSPYEF